MSEINTQIPKIKDFRPFIPCSRDGHNVSLKFYQDLGFKKLWGGGGVSEIDTGFGQRFLLLEKYNKGLAENLIIHIWVDSVDEWYEYIKPKKLDEKYPGVRVGGPDILPWGWRILYVWDPAGVLLHIAEPHSEKNIQFFSSADWLNKE